MVGYGNRYLPGRRIRRECGIDLRGADVLDECRPAANGHRHTVQVCRQIAIDEVSSVPFSCSGRQARAENADPGAGLNRPHLVRAVDNASWRDVRRLGQQRYRGERAGKRQMKRPPACEQGYLKSKCHDDSQISPIGNSGKLLQDWLQLRRRSSVYRA